MSDEARHGDTGTRPGSTRHDRRRAERRAADSPRAGRGPDRRCPACQGITLLQEKWVLHIVHALLDGPQGFNAIGRKVGGCNPTTLTQRLGRLEQLGLIVKDQGNGTCRACYRLTDAGAHLEDVITAIDRWADEHLPDERAGPT